MTLTLALKRVLPALVKLKKFEKKGNKSQEKEVSSFLLELHVFLCCIWRCHCLDAVLHGRADAPFHGAFLLVG